MEKGCSCSQGTSPRREGSEGILRVRRQTGHQGSRKGVETSGAAGAYTVLPAPLHMAPVVPSRVQIPLFPQVEMKHGDEAKVTLGHLQVSSAQARSCGQVRASSERLTTVCLSKHISLSVKLQSICPTPGAFETWRWVRASVQLLRVGMETQRYVKAWKVVTFILLYLPSWSWLVQSSFAADFVASCHHVDEPQLACKVKKQFLHLCMGETLALSTLILRLLLTISYLYHQQILELLSWVDYQLRLEISPQILFCFNFVLLHRIEIPCILQALRPCLLIEGEILFCPALSSWCLFITVLSFSFSTVLLAC